MLYPAQFVDRRSSARSVGYVLVALIASSCLGAAESSAQELEGLPDALQGSWIDTRDRSSAGDYTATGRSSSCSAVTLEHIQRAADGMVSFVIADVGTVYRITTVTGKGFHASIWAKRSATAPLSEVDSFDFTITKPK